MEAIHASILCLFYVFISSKYFYFKTRLDRSVNLTLQWMSEGYKVMLIYISSIYLRNTSSVDVLEISSALFVSMMLIATHASIFIVFLFMYSKPYNKPKTVNVKPLTVNEDLNEFARVPVKPTVNCLPEESTRGCRVLDPNEPIVVYFITGLILSCSIIYILKGGL